MHKRQVRDYFGEEYALYFAWLGMYTALLGPLAVVGTILFGVQMWNDPMLKFDNPIVCGAAVLFSFVIACWMVYLTARWVIQERILGLRWGMGLPSGAEPMSRQLPQFKADQMVVDRVRPYRYIKSAKKKKQRLRFIVSSALIGVSVVAAALLANSDLQGFLFQFLGVSEQTLNYSIVPGNLLPLSSIITAVVVKIVETIYQEIAEAAVRLENPEYEADAYDSHIVKRFTFVNLDYFSSMIYIAFLKRYLTEAGDEVLQELRSQLLAQWAIESGLNVLKQYQPRFLYKWNTSGMISVSDVERQYYLPVHEGTLEEYIEMVMQLGLVTLFSSVLPVIPALIWLTNH